MLVPGSTGLKCMANLLSVSLNDHFFNFFTSIGGAPKFVSMIYALMYVGILFIPAYFLYKRKIFIKL
jgi:predicted acyltransferase